MIAVYETLNKIKDKHKYGVILNTSFNLNGRTNVLRPEDAIIDFLDWIQPALQSYNFVRIARWVYQMVI